MQFVQPVLHNLKGTGSRLFGICGCGMHGTQQFAFLAVLSKVAKHCVVSHTTQQAATVTSNALLSVLSLTRCESRELWAKVVLGMILHLPFYWATLSLCLVAVLLYASDLELPTVKWRATGALHTFFTTASHEVGGGREYKNIVSPFFVAHMGFAHIVSMH